MSKFYEVPSDDVLLEWTQYKPHGDHKPGDTLPEGGVCEKYGVIGETDWTCGWEDV